MASRTTMSRYRHGAHPIAGWFGIIFFSLAAGLIGTLLHRSGADRGIPWGLALALLLLFATAWWSRRAHGLLGLAICLLLSTGLIWLVGSNYGPGGDILVPIASKAFTTFWSKNAGYTWIVGATIVQLIVMFFPAHLFEVPATPAHVAD